MNDQDERRSTNPAGPGSARRRTLEKVHTYPSNYRPGTHWAITVSWEVLDFINPGVLSDDTRALLAGMIAGQLMKERERAARIAIRGRSPHVAEAIRHEP